MKPTKQSWFLAGGLLSALAASLCCLGPLLAIILGLGGFAASSRFVEWRPYFLAASVGLLAAAWYLTYRRPTAACADGEAGVPSAIRKGPKLFLWIVTALAIPAALLPTLLSVGGTPMIASAADSTELRVSIPTMDCPACAKGIEATLRRTPGVIRAVVDYDTKNAVIAFDQRKTAVTQLVAAIDRTGFKAAQVSQLSATSSGGALAKAEACCAPEGKAAPAVAVAADRNSMNPDHISLFNVPLVCPAAPEIGCGSRAKPLLAELERDSGIAEAWLNSTGTILAVVGRETSSRESRAKVVRLVLSADNAVGTELAGMARHAALNDFFSNAGWHRGAAVDDLSRQEAGIIAARLVHRLQGKIPLAEQKAKTLERRFTEVFTRRFTIEETDPQRPSNDRNWRDAILTVASDELAKTEVASLQEAIVSGYRPQPNEK